MTLSGPSNNTVTVDFATANGTAQAGTDYQAVTGTVTFAPNETRQTITVNVNGDQQIELDETFFVNLSNPTNATIIDSQGQGTIANDDSSASPVLSINDVTLAEGDAGTTTFIFTVTLNAAVGGPISVDFATADGTAIAAGTAISDRSGTNSGEVNDHDRDGESGEKSENGDNLTGDDEHPQDATDGDYLATSGALHFAGRAGETQTITVSVRGDTQVEPDETFFVNLSNPVGAAVANGQGTGTILNDDARADLAVTLHGATRVAPGRTMVYTIGLTNNGPEDASGSLVTDVFPVGLSNLSWTAVATGGAAGAVSGIGDISQTVDLPVHSTITYTATGTVTAEVGTVLSNTVRVSAAAAIMDPAVGNHSQTLSTTVSARPSQNPREPHDVDDADGVTPLDVLTLINYLNAHPGDGVLPGSHELPTPYYDVSGDGFCSALDVLMVVNHINAPPTGAGEGEAVPLETLPLQPVAAAMTNAKPESTLNSVSSTSGGEVLRTAQQDSIQGSSAASAWPAEDQTPLAAKADTAHQRLHREQHAKGDLFVRGIDPAGLESVLSDIGPDIDRAWQRR